ncbi:MAG: UDP-3-O-[3-hydroxymyristoyl] glucosamine N-acyltransferase (EC [uncultured Sulfurovum sp.]|uniref:UDP-3-O-acylglucosamine N-acyltransferase n=1 Tax=uncultured Sulfurovum sp. TaxID=269237 RepID=A0A6S6T2E2_9BACT|nr:MAG: UDP-3-O-[3-hydroxymyristoyl] glucosamine N-acyltransferase (EC [uncultured Sulfurovum sp.]
MKLSKISEAIEVKYKGADIDIKGLHTLDEADPSHISFFNDEKYIGQLVTTKAGAVLIALKYVNLLPKTTIPLITDEAYLKLALASKFFTHQISTSHEAPNMGSNCTIDTKVSFGRGVFLGDNVTIMAGTYVGDNVCIASNTLIYPNVTIYHDSIIGSECIIHAGTVIGSDGYGFAHTKQGHHIKIYQNGNVVIEDNVEVGANCVVDRAVFGSTYIRQGSKLDNLVQIAHNCDIGEHSLLAGQVGMAGSTTTGRNIVMGGQSGTAGHLHLEDFTTIAGKGGVTKSLKGGKTYAGFPAIDHKVWLRLQAKLAFLVKKK